MRKLLLVAILAIAGSAFANNPFGVKDPFEVRFIKDGKRMPNEAIQRELRAADTWQNFLQANGTWYVKFGEENRLPHNAFGKPISVAGADLQSQAWNFVTEKLSAFEIPIGELELVSARHGARMNYVDYRQVHQGIPVLFSKLKVKITDDSRVVGFMSDVYDVDVNISPSINETAATSNAISGITDEIEEVELISGLKILPVPENFEMKYHLVYEVMVASRDSESVPAHYRTLVDAHSGEVLYRTNEVAHCGHDHSEPPLPGGPEAMVTADVHESNPFIPVVNNPLANLRIQQGGNVSYTDGNGYVSGLTAGNATISLEGLWSTVYTNNVTPSFNATINSGPTAISFNGDATVQERSAFFHVNIVHDYMKSKFPTFTGLDFSLETNVDLTSGSCNAFYNGSSINFYAEGAGCTTYATVGDVVYHEYGHGINDFYYQSIGAFWQNGAMGEGYADIWALGITNNPILGEGTSTTDPTNFIRRYDIDPQVYPDDISGGVHQDGEIIAGAWWDLGQIWGDLQQMMDLFAASYDAGITGPGGTEGDVYVDILIEALTLDDSPANGGDNDITNGTPNDIDIVTAFDLHGITLLSNATLSHSPIEFAESEDLDIDVTITLVYPWGLEAAKLFHRVNDETAWNETELVNSSGNNYSATIPEQPNGSVIAYYVALENLNGVLAGVQPLASHLDPYPNLPYFIMVGYDVVHWQDFDTEQDPGWLEGNQPGDGATTGIWTIDVPIPTYSDDGIIVQTDEDYTPGSGNIACALTGNASSPTEGIGVQDVDDGRTTLVSPVFDLTQYDNPGVTYQRYYTNNPPTGANPGADWWQVEITADGSNWIYLENNLTSDKRWRRMAFRVADYLPITSTFQMRFVASDSIRPGQNLDGGSLIEGAMDDLYFYEEAEEIGVQELDGLASLMLYPNPASDDLVIKAALTDRLDAGLRVIDVTGREVIPTKQLSLPGGTSSIRLDTRMLDSGSYLLLISDGENVLQRQFSIAR